MLIQILDFIKKLEDSIGNGARVLLEADFKKENLIITVYWKRNDIRLRYTQLLGRQLVSMIYDEEVLLKRFLAVAEREYQKKIEELSNEK